MRDRALTDDQPHRVAVLAVDGGNSKTDVVLLDRRGDVLGFARGPGSNHSHSDHQSAMRLIDDLVAQAALGLGRGLPSERPTAEIAAVAVLCLAGADFPVDKRRLAAAAAEFGWADRLLIRNDAAAILRAGTDNELAVALVCGAGVNCVGRGRNGRTFGFPALGSVSGDWGGGQDIGMAALAAAVRASDGRGPATTLAHLVPHYFGVARPSGLVFAIHTGRIEESRVIELPALVFAAAAAGDEVAGAIVDRQADELAVMAAAAIRRLQLRRSAVDVVLGGGILTSGDSRLLDRVTAGVVAVAPAARIIALRTLPVAGAALLGLDELNAVPTTDVRKALGSDRPIKEDW